MSMKDLNVEKLFEQLFPEVAYIVHEREGFTIRHQKELISTCPECRVVETDLYGKRMSPIYHLDKTVPLGLQTRSSGPTQMVASHDWIDPVSFECRVCGLTTTRPDRICERGDGDSICVPEGRPTREERRTGLSRDLLKTLQDEHDHFGYDIKDAQHCEVCDLIAVARGEFR